MWLFYFKTGNSSNKNNPVNESGIGHALRCINFSKYLSSKHKINSTLVTNINEQSNKLKKKYRLNLIDHKNLIFLLNQNKYKIIVLYLQKYLEWAD